MDNKAYVNEGKDDEMEIQGFRLNKIKRFVLWIGYLLTVGFLHLVLYWLPHVRVWLIYDECSLGKASCVLLKMAETHVSVAFTDIVCRLKTWMKATETCVSAIKDKHNQKIVCEVDTITRDGTCIKLAKPRKKFFEKSRYSIQTANPEEDTSILRYFTCKKIKYFWDTETLRFVPLRGLDEGYKLSYLHTREGLSREEQTKLRVFNGHNAIEVHVTPVIRLLFKEALSPFYIFQLFSVSVWFSDEYYIYSACILVVSSFSIIITIYQTRKFERALRNTISSTNLATVCRGGEEYQNVSSVDLVPGDVIEIPRHGLDMQCDAVLITGTCIVNESMLTGESVPVTKTSLPIPTKAGDEELDPELNMKQHSRHVLFCGTHVIQTRFYGNQKVKAVVIRTGFSTAKGELVRSIMFPKPVDFKFQRHSYYFVLFLAGLAVVGFIYTITIMINRDSKTSEIVLRSLDLITIAVPPALPAALAVCVVFSQRRLRNQQVYCISPKGINICGTTSVVCFDKTGTLTEDGLDMQGVVKVDNAKFEKMETNLSRLTKGPLLTAMATCHSLTIINDEIMGDPLDLIMFEATNWELEEPGPDETRFDMMVPTIVKPKSKGFQKPSSQLAGEDVLKGEDVGIVRQFPFSSSLQRMSVITRQLASPNFELYVKGSPEMITSLSKPDTVPFDFHEKLQKYTKKGYRVIALAWKPLPVKLNYVKIQRLNRDTVENNLNFLGLLVMENRVKPQTSAAIATLVNADIKTVMVTGDNMLTALSVSRECGMVDPSERVILVQAYPPESGIGAKTDNIAIDFVYADDQDALVEEVFAMEDHRLQISEENQRFHFAMTGKTWGVIRKYQPDLLDKLVVRGLVFARMSPDQKAQLVEVLQNVGYYVGMCGDGANDCGALKAAHMGISLSEAEASVASPFTSKNPTIECVPHVIKEGRASLVTTFGVFKYIACYSLTQFISVLILYWNGSNLTDGEFLYCDFWIITSFSITFGWTRPYDTLVKDRPLVSLLSPSPLLSIITQIALCTAAQTFVYWDVQQQPWFLPFVPNEDEDKMCHENMAIFLMSSYILITYAITFSKGAPFRKTFASNWWMLANFILAFGGHIWITLYPTNGLAELMEFALFPSMTYRAVYVGYGLAFFLVSVLLEKFVIDNEFIRGKVRNVLCKCVPVSGAKYETIENEMDKDPNWPPVLDDKVDLAEIFQRLDNVPHQPSDLYAPKSPSADPLEKLLDYDAGDNEMTPHDGNGTSQDQSPPCYNGSSSLHTNAIFEHTSLKNPSINQKMEKTEL